MKLLLFVSLLCLFGCSESSSPENKKLGTIQELYPLNVGNKWVYKYIYSPTDPSGIIPEFLTIQVLSSQTFKGVKMYQVSRDGDKSFWFYDSTTALYSTADTNSSSTQYLLHSPLTIDEPFVLQAVTTGSTVDKAILTLAEENTSITTDAGTFNCFHFVETDYKGDLNHPDTSMVDQWYAKNIGMVRNRYSEWKAGVLKEHGGWDLQSYILK